MVHRLAASQSRDKDVFVLRWSGMQRSRAWGGLKDADDNVLWRNPSRRKVPKSWRSSQDGPPASIGRRRTLATTSADCNKKVIGRNSGEVCRCLLMLGRVRPALSVEEKGAWKLR